MWSKRYSKTNLSVFLITLLLIFSGSGCNQPVYLPTPPTYPGLQHLPDLREQPHIVWQMKQPSPVSLLTWVKPSSILVMSHRGEAYLVSLQTGDRESSRWQPFNSGISAYAFDRENGLLFLVSQRAEEIKAFDLTRKESLWKQSVPEIGDDIVVGNDRVFLCDRTGQLWALNKNTGTVVTTCSLRVPINKGVLGWGNELLVLTNDGILRAFSRDLVKLWSSPLDVCLETELLPDSTGLYFVGCNGEIWFLDREEHHLRLLTDLETKVYSPLTTVGNQLIVATADGRVFSLDKETGAIIWEFGPGPGLINLPVQIAGNVLIITYARGTLLALDRNSGREMWRFSLDHPIEYTFPTTKGLVIVDTERTLTLLK
jgi:outer membrane protein assembly factor BamB